MNSEGSDSVSEMLRQIGEVRTPQLAVDVERRRKERLARAVEARLESARRTQALRRRAAGVLAGGLLLAAGVAFVLRDRSSGDDAPRVISSHGEVALLPSTSATLPAGAGIEDRQLRTGAGAGARLALASKATMAVRELTALTVHATEPDTERVTIALGHASFTVPKLTHGRRLIVETPDTTITVRGTAFAVDVAREGQSATLVTRVLVSEGRVEVMSGPRFQLLLAGSEWTSAAAVMPAPSVQPEASSDAVSTMETVPRPAHASDVGAQPLRVRERHDVVPPGPSTDVVGARQSELAEQNRLFARALERAQAGALQPALVDLATLIREHPRSPLLQSARVEHFRLLHRAGQTEAAAREARAYLSAFPNGFARAEAKQLALADLGSP